MKPGLGKLTRVDPRPEGSTLSDTLRAVFPSADIAVASLMLDQHVTTLFDAEAAQTEGWTEQARSQFAGGRECARQALAHLGVRPAPIVRMPDGLPAWPPGFVGSISHKRQVCVAVAARLSLFASVGVDIELCESGEAAWWADVCTDRELLWVRAAVPEEQALRAAVIFSAKESFYKAQYPLTRDDSLEFEHVELAVDPGRGSFSVRAHASTPASLLAEMASGHLGIAHPLVCTGVTLPHDVGENCWIYR